MNIEQEKARIRAIIRAKREHLNKEYLQQASLKIIEQIYTLSEYQSAGTIFCYVSTIREVDTTNFINRAIQSGKRIVVPKCQRQGIMHLYEIKGMSDLKPGMLGILEPADTLGAISKKEIDLAIVPCLSCNRNGWRLGQGGGYYDRFMKNRSYPAAALCPETLLYSQIPIEPWDLQMDMVITEERVYRP